MVIRVLMVFQFSWDQPVLVVPQDPLLEVTRVISQEQLVFVDQLLVATRVLLVLVGQNQQIVCVNDPTSTNQNVPVSVQLGVPSTVGDVPVGSGTASVS